MMTTEEMETRELPKSKKRRSKKRVWLIVLITVLSLLILSGGALAAVGLSVSNGDTVFPNVRIAGISVGGMTQEEAAAHLAAPMGEDSAWRSVMVSFPNGSAIEIFAEDVGLTITGEQAAELAFRYGRNSNIFSNSLAFLRCNFFTVDLDPFTFFTADELMLQRVVHNIAEELDLLSESNYEVTDTELILTQGLPMVRFDENHLMELISEAFLKSALEVDYYRAPTTDAEPIDLEWIYDGIFAEPESAYFNIETDEIAEHVMGVSFDIALAAQMLAGAMPGEQVFVPLILIEPELTADYLREVLFRDVLAYSTTNLTNDENRNTNIHVAASHINEMVLNPGDQFDFNTVVGQRTVERGFRPGGAFSGTQIIQSIGGGICQVSSTIYHALLHTEMQIDARINHTLVVTYLPLGMDAAVAWGGPNFTFTNNQDFPIRIVAYRDGLEFHVRIYGTNTSPYARIVPEGVYLNSVGYETTFRDDPTMQSGQTRVYTAGRIGHVVEVFQRFYDENDNLVRRELVARSSYRPVAQVVLRGTAAAPAAPPPADTPPADPPPADGGE